MIDYICLTAQGADECLSDMHFRGIGDINHLTNRIRPESFISTVQPHAELP
jgi:hypothetical protein